MEAADTIRLREHFNAEPTCDPSAGYPERPMEWFDDKVLPLVKLERDRMGARPASLIDVGCGYGYFTRRYRDICGTVIGLDFSPARIEGAKELHRKHGLAFYVADITRGEAMFKAHLVVTSAVIQHVPPARRVVAVQFLWDCLRTGGRLITVDSVWTENDHAWDGHYEALKDSDLARLFTLDWRVVVPNPHQEAPIFFTVWKAVGKSHD